MVDIKVIKALIKGLLTFIPGLACYIRRNRSGSSHSGSNAEFCYSLWLSILVNFKENGIHPNLTTVGEIGNGGSFGVGICALLTGSEVYYALEVEDLLYKEQNLKLLDEIVSLFKNRTPINSSFKQLNIKINNYEYPEDIINPFFLRENLITQIRKEIINGFCHSAKMKVVKNWYGGSPLNLDFIFSRAVMEHVKDPGVVYCGVFYHSKETSYMFHDIEFHSHGITKKVNGHYFISNFMWKMIFGRRKYFLNRWKLSEHLSVMKEHDFKLVSIHKTILHDESNQDGILYGAAILARK